MSDGCVSVCLMDVFDAPLLILLLLVAVRADLRVVVVAASHDVQYFSRGPVPDGVTLHRPLLGGTPVERLETHPVTARLYSETYTQPPAAASEFLAPSLKPAVQRVQALADTSRSALYAFAVYKAISLHTCMLS